MKDQDRFYKIMQNIDSCTTKDQLESCSNLKEAYCKQIKDNDQAPNVKASLEGMIVLKEYQLKNKSK